MADVGLVDVSLRDGNQSLWGAAGLRTAHVLQVAPLLERVGFRALDYSSSTAMGMLVRTHRENPWELFRRTRRLMPTTKLQFIGTGFRFISWQNSHPETMQLVYDRLVESGIDRVVVLDPMHDMDAARATARRLKRAGVDEVVGALTFTISAVHDDAFYIDLARQMRECPDIDRVYVKDPAGILTAERARMLLPAIKAELRDMPLPRHHRAVSADLLDRPGARRRGRADRLRRAGQRLLAAGGAAHGGQPAGDGTSRRHRRSRARPGLRLLRPAGRRGGTARGPATGLRCRVPPPPDRRWGDDHDPSSAARFESLIEEVGRVRAELGYPIMVTPFPQMVVSQALFNVIGERYANVPDQVIRYVLGSFGRPTTPIDPSVQDRILDRPRARELAAEPDPPTPAELRRQFGTRISDEELLLRAHMPAEQVDAMLAAGPAPDHYNPELTSVLHLLGELGERRSVHDLAVAKPNLRLFVHRHRDRSQEGAVRD